MVFCVTAAALIALLSPPTCRDGWASRSIGEQNACSCHGGVAPTLAASFGSIGAAAGVRALVRLCLNRRRRPPSPDPTPILHPELRCTLCGRAMRYVPPAKSGKVRGFWRCVHYPACNWTERA